MSKIQSPDDEQRGRANLLGVAGGLSGVHTFTVLFTDLVASTATRARLGEDAFDPLRTEHDDLTAATIAALKGTMVKHTGDGALALFVGAGDALACATRLQQLLERRNRGAVEKIEIRAGLSMGDVVIEADDVQGIAVVEARRLCDAAQTGQVLCSDLVRAASGARGGHRFGPVTERELKGLGAPLASCELVWADGEGGGEPPRFRVFGPLAVQRDGLDLPLAGPKERAVLAALVAAEGAPVSTDALAQAVWGDSPPRSARRTIQAYIARLRATVGSQPGGEPWLTSHGSAYVLEVDRENVDALRFTDLAAVARGLLERGDPGAAVTAFDDALALWRAKPYDGFEDIERCAAATRSLEELRSNVIEDRFDALLALGQSSELVPELEGVLSAEPFRERLWGQLMVALYRSGRQADALRAYQRARRVLADELGIEPGPALRDLEEAILAQDDHRLRRGAGGQPIVALPAALDVAGAALVGRDEELARLRAAWDGARNHQTGYVAVVGPEGIGKTRLVSALAAEAHSAGAVTCYARSDPAHRSARALFDQALRSAGTSLLQAQSAALPGESLGTSIARSLADWSTRSPILLVLDDLHAADDEVLEVVAEIPSAAAGAALLVVAIFRTEPDDTAMRSSGGQQIMLGGIDKVAVAELCALYGDAWTTAEVDRLHAETYGIPLAVHEEAAAWARDAAGRRLDDAADQAQLAEHRLLLSQQAVADEVVGIQRLVEQRRQQLPAAGGSSLPFKGLVAFDVEDAPWFFGRERLVAELAARLATRPVLAVVGASGSGKSSLVRAGLLPALAAGSLPGSDSWRVVVTTPGAAPCADLDRALEAVAGDGPRLLVVVDQLEELFTHCDDAAEREEFGQELQRLVDDGAMVVATLRADQMGPLSEVLSLALLLRGNDVLVGPIRERELRDVIERPAQRAGLQLEQGLVEQILADAQGSSGVLPLLQTALLATWERRTGNVLTRGAYQESGGVQGAVARLAETTFDGLTPCQQDAARRILLRLAEASDDGTLDLRRRVRVDDIASRDDADARVAYEEMVRHRLLISTQDTVEVSHEALLREWPRLREWLQDDVEGRRLHQRLGDSARAWAVGDRDESELLRGTRLSATLDWTVAHPDDLNDVEREFLEASRELAGREVAEANERADREARTSKRLRRLVAGMAALLVVALAAGALAVVQRDRADDAATAANAESVQARVNRLVAESDRELDSHLDLALLLAVEARRRDDSPATRGALLTALTHNITSERLRPGASPSSPGLIHATNSSFLGFLAGPPRLQLDVDVSDDGRTVASAGLDETGDGGLVLIFDTATREEIGRITDDTPIFGVDVSSDGSEVLARGAELFLFDTDTATTTVLPIEPPEGEELQLALFEPDTERVLVIASNRTPDVEHSTWMSAGTTLLWDRATQSPVDVALPPGPVTAAGFRPDGTLVADQPNWGTVSWDVETGRPIRTLQLQEPPTEISRLVLTSDGARLIGEENQGRVFVWDTTTGSLVGDPAVRPGTVRGLATSPKAAATIAIGSAGGGFSFYDLTTERVIGEPIYGHGAGIRDLEYSTSGEYLVSVAEDGLIGLWGSSDAPGLISRPVAKDARNPSPSDDGSGMLIFHSVLGHPEVRSGDALTDPGIRVTAPEGASWGMLSDDGSLVLVAGGDTRTLSVSDAQTGGTVWTNTDGGFPTAAADIDGDSGLVVAVDRYNEDRLRVWDTATGRILADASASDLPGVSDDGWFTGVPRFTDDGSFIDIPVGFGVGRFRAEDLEPVAFVPLSFVAQDVESIPGSDHVLAGGGSGRLARVNIATGAVDAEGRSADPSGLGYVEVSPDGTVVVVYHPLSYQLALFDAATLRPLGEPFPVGDYIFEPHFTADGRSVIGNGLFPGWAEWDVDPDVWQEQACLAAGRNLTEAEWDEYLGTDEPYRATCDR